MRYLFNSLLKELRNYKPKLFFGLHKNKRKHNQQSKLLFFTINIHIATLNQISTYRKLSLTGRIYLVEQNQTDQSIPHVFDFVWKETTYKLLIHLFFINNPFLTLAPKIVWAFLKNRPKKLFSNCLVNGLLTSIV